MIGVSGAAAFVAVVALVSASVAGCANTGGDTRGDARAPGAQGALAPGMQLALTYLRSGRAQTATVTLAASCG